MNSDDLERFLALAPAFVGGQFQLFGFSDWGSGMQILAPISGPLRIEGQRIICPCSAQFSTGNTWLSEPGTDFTLPGNLERLVSQTLPSGRVMLWLNIPRDETIAVLFPKGDSGGTETFTGQLDWDCHPMDVVTIGKIARPILSLAPASPP